MAQARILQIQFPFDATPRLIRQAVLAVGNVDCPALHLKQFEVNGVVG